MAGALSIMATTAQIITRIKRRLSRSNSNIDETILDELAQTQEWLEGRPTLPRWLIEEEEVALAAGTAVVDLSTLTNEFVRFIDDKPVSYENPDSDEDGEEWLELKRFVGESELLTRHPGTGELRGWVIQNLSLIVRQIPEEATTLRLKFYTRAEAPAVDNETVWTQNASEILIHHTGLEVAHSLRDSNAVSYFDSRRKEALRNYLNSLVADEMAGMSSSRGED
jgi:hypothetical protein